MNDEGAPFRRDDGKCFPFKKNSDKIAVCDMVKYTVRSPLCFCGDSFTEAGESGGQQELVTGPPRNVDGLAVKVPDGWKVTMSKKVLCQKSFKSREIKSQYAWQKQMMSSTMLGL